MATEIKMPQFGVSMETGTIAKWLKKPGDPVQAGEALVSVETEKLTNEVESEADGVLLSIVAQEGDEVPVGGLLAVVGAAGEQPGAGAEPAQPAATAAAPAEAPRPAAPAAPAAGRIKASPLARKVAANLGIALGDVTATGTSGRIRARDVYACAERAQSAPAAPAAESVQPVSGGALTAFPVKNLELMEGDTTERLTGMRKVVAQRMFASHAEIPTVTQTMKVDVTELLEFRRSLNAQREQKLSVNDFILKAVAKALRQHPEMLVSLDGEQIIHRAHVNLGMAVAVEGGLLVPVIRDADRLGLAELAEQARDFASRGRNQQLTADEYKGSTFTVSNLGMYGIESFTPIINQPDAAILGINAIQDELQLLEDGSVCGRKVMRISLTYDHRLVDGAVAATFEQCVRDLLQTPIEILL